MPNPKPKTAHLKPFQVRTPEQGRALAALSPGRPGPERPLRPWSGKLYADQLEVLTGRGVNASALIRELVDVWIAEHPEK